MTRAKQIPAILPHGPSAQPPAYHSIDEILMKVKPILTGTNEEKLFANELDEATKQWYTLAREEFGGLMSEEVPFSDAKFRWAPAVKNIAKPWTGDNARSSMWRGLAGRANEVARIVGHNATDESHTAQIAPPPQSRSKSVDPTSPFQTR